MYDFVRCSCTIDPTFSGINKTCDIKSFGGTMNTYWISPSGSLHFIDYTDTASFVELKPGDVHYNHYKKHLNFHWVPNGNHGKITPVFSTRTIHIQPVKWCGNPIQIPRASIHFHNGLVDEITYTY